MQDKVIMKKDKSRDNLQNRNMFSKFLYYSLADTEPSESDAAHGDGGTRRVRRNSAPDSAVQVRVPGFSCCDFKSPAFGKYGILSEITQLIVTQ